METSPPILFDRARLRKSRARRALSFPRHDFLHREAAVQLAESLAFIRHPFPTMVELGSHTGQLGSLLATRPGTERYIQCDLSPAVLNDKSGLRVALDAELLPFAENSVDAVVSVLDLHWVNDLPGSLAQICRMLKPDGLFMAVVPGGETLRELRHILTATDIARTGGAGPRVAPFIDVRDAGALLQRAGFALPVADSDQLTITYPSMFALMDDLRSSGQSNMLIGRTNHFTPKAFFMDAAARYAAEYNDAEERIPATVELITLTGWKPSVTQQQPAKRGSGKVSLTEVFKQ